MINFIYCSLLVKKIVGIFSLLVKNHACLGLVCVWYYLQQSSLLRIEMANIVKLSIRINSIPNI